jgi:DMSO/TMAO reductase YedYZ heme-binding membrane subunit
LIAEFNLATTGSVAVVVIHHATQSWAWYLVRASGLMALVLLILLILSGIGLITGYTFRFLEPVAAWAVHRAMAIGMIVSIMVHGTFLLFDKFVPFTIFQVLVPFSSNFHRVSFAGIPLGSLFIAFGVVSFYALLLVVLTSLLIRDRAKKIWKLIHYLSYLSVVLVYFHALNTGTDFESGPLRVVWIAVGVLLLAAFATRLRRAGALKAASRNIHGDA